MRSQALNGALAAVSTAALIAACSQENTPRDTPAARAVTFNADIAPILFDNCASCHRPIDEAAARAAAMSGSADDPICVAGAPFSVLDYASARRIARRCTAGTW